MRGEVLQADGPEGVGTILGEDGQRYQYTQVQVKTGVQLVAGQSVDFVSMGSEARDIYPLSGGATNVPPPQSAAPQQAMGQQIPQPSYAQPVAGYAPGAVPMAVPARQGDGLWTYFVRCLTKNYVQFNGRARRSEYWGFTLFITLFFILAVIIDVVISVVLSESAGTEMFLPIFTVLLWLAVILPSLAVTVRRFHDQDLSGWLYLLSFIPYVGGLVIFVFMVLDGKPMTNKHGPSPKYMMDDATTQAFL
ncbi:MAG: DUF805 domain-containing protein [Hyphomonas sp.]